MSSDLREQIRQVVVLIEDSQAPILGADVRAGSVGLAPTLEDASPPMRRLVIVAVTFAVVLILVGGVAWLLPNTDSAPPASELTTPTTIASTNTTVAEKAVQPFGDGPQLNFVPVELPSGERIRDGVWFQGALYAISGGNGLFRSSDGFTWERLAGPPDVANLQGSHGLQTGGELLVYAGVDGGEANIGECSLPGDAIVVHTSNNGVDWKTSRIDLPIPDSSTTIACYRSWVGLEHGFAVGPQGIMISAVVQGEIIPDGHTGSSYAWFSPDGQAWNQLDASGPLDGGDIAALVATSGGFVATSTISLLPIPSGPAQEILWETTDGTTWIQRSRLDERLLADPCCLVVWNGQLISASDNGVWTIEDTPRELIPSEGMSGMGIQISGLGLTGIHTRHSGAGTEVLFSQDGTTWNRWTPPGFAPSDGQVRFVGVGDDFVVLWVNNTHWIGRLP